MDDKLKIPLGMLILFLTVGSVLTLTLNNIFYLFNFAYIGVFLSVGIYLIATQNRYGRNIVQLCVGLYMLVFLGLILQENMLLSGFFYYLFLGVFEAAVIHYLIAKIFGPLLFGRGWCGYACWIVMIFEFLPYKTPKTHTRIKHLGLLRYILFGVIMIGVASLFYFKVPNLEYTMFLIFVIGNIIYYLVGILLAYILKDNHAFCKYVCPITTFLKPMSYFSLLRVHCNIDTCSECNKCREVCPMDVDMVDNKRSRSNGTECILCLNCINNCPNKSLDI